jgi:prepilin-type N-terminal cleavage/methylation domain-containing protein
MHNKKGFSLIELSLVVVIISVMLSTVLISRSLILSARNNKIQEEYRILHASINIFRNQYECLPGDCNPSQIPDIMPFMPNYVAPTISSFATSDCTAPIGAGSNSSLVMNSGAIDSTAKRTCMMLQLQAGGYIDTLNYIYGVDSLLNTVAGKNIPFASFSRQAAWDFRVVTGSNVNPNSGVVTFPQANGLGGCTAIAPTVGNGLYRWCGFHELVLRNANLTAASITQDISSALSTARYAISANQAYKLDLKFDDGLPYSGNISGLRSASNTANNAHCTILAGDENTGANLTSAVLYQVTNDITTGCITSYLIKQAA